MHPKLCHFPIVSRQSDILTGRTEHGIDFMIFSVFFSLQDLSISGYVAPEVYSPEVLVKPRLILLQRNFSEKYCKEGELIFVTRTVYHKKSACKALDSVAFKKGGNYFRGVLH